nr:50s ribosomal protein l7/l12 [Quercus suber]
MKKPRKMCSSVFMDEKFYVIRGIGGPYSKVLFVILAYNLRSCRLLYLGSECIVTIVNECHRGSYPEAQANRRRDLTKLERYELNKYGPAVSGLGPSATFKSEARLGVEAKAAEKSAFDLKLEKYNAAVKIKIIKEVRTFMDLGLKEAKELVEKVLVVNEK